MPHLELADDEAALLEEILSTWLAELKTEIADTESREFKLKLEDKRRAGEAMLRRLKARV